MKWFSELLKYSCCATLCVNPAYFATSITKQFTTSTHFCCCRCLGCFNLSVYTTEADLRDLFGEFGEIEKVCFSSCIQCIVCIFLYICISPFIGFLKVELVYDHPTGRSRGFGFVYFDRLEDACAARDKLSGKEIDGHKVGAVTFLSGLFAC